MSRKYLNDRWCVRCGRTSPCPYLKDNMKLFNKNKLVVDCGCGNGRNAKYLKSIGFKKVVALDMVGDFGIKCVLGKDKIPAKNKSAGLILCTYIFMFLNKKERKKLFNEVNRVADKNCYLMVELYPAKDSFFKTLEASLNFQKKLYNDLERRGWGKIKYSKQKFLMEKVK